MGNLARGTWIPSIPSSASTLDLDPAKDGLQPADRPTAREGGRAPQFSKLEGHAAVVFSWTSSTGAASAFAGPSSI